MDKKAIITPNAPSPIGPYSQAILTGNILFISGQICIDPQTGELNNESIQAETHQVMKNIQGILNEAGMGFGNIVKSSIFITDMNRFAEVNEVYGKYFESESHGNNSPFPARETIQVSALPKFVNVEISAIAVK